jgi:hypothetical protein
MNTINVIYLNRHDSNSFITTVNGSGQGSVCRDQEIIHSDVQLPFESFKFNAVVPTYVAGEPCIAIAGLGSKGAGVYLHHAVTLCEVRYVPSKENLNCVCINATGTKAFFGTDSGRVLSIVFVS